MPRPRNQEEEEIPTDPGPVETPPPDPAAPRPPRILAPSRWNSRLWGNDPGDEGGVVYDRPDYTDGPYGPGGGPPAAETPAAGNEGGDEGGGKKPRHLTIYGGRGYNEDGSLRDPAESSGSGSAGGGGSKASGSSSGSGSSASQGGGVGPEQPYEDLTKTIQDSLNGILGGTELPFSPDAIARMKDAVFASTSGQARAGQDQINRDLIRRGVFRSGVGAQAGADLQRAALQQYGQGATQVQITAAQENFNAKMGALDRAQKHLDGYRQYILQKEMTEVERQKALDTIKLGYARIAADERMLSAQIAAQKKLGGGGGGADPFNTFLAQYFSGGGSAPAPPF